MTRIHIDIDERLVRRAMAEHGLRTPREAIDLALRRLLGEPMTREDALAMEGTGWDGDLDAMRGATVDEEA